MQLLTKDRRNEEELMDLPSTSKVDFKQALQDIQWVNRRLGGTKAILSEVEPYLTRTSTPLRILDLGTGSADIPIAIAERANELKQTLQITCVDFHPTAVEVARQITAPYSEIEIIQVNALSLDFPDRSFDLVISSMFMHHLQKEEAVLLLQEMARLSSQAFIINDLERDDLAYLAISLLGRMTNKGKVFLNDAPLSVLRGFNRVDLEELRALSNLPGLQFNRYFPYRWIIKYSHD